MTSQYLEADLIRDEGEELIAYLDSLGNVTWGIGHKDNSVAVGTVFMQSQVDAQFQIDKNAAIAGISGALPWWPTLDDLRQDVLVNMTFNMGLAGVLGFHRTLTFIEDSDWEDAAAGMLASKWAGQVGARATRLAEQMRTGVHQ